MIFRWIITGYWRSDYFLEKYNPKQFELLGIMNTGEINRNNT